jgi:hypothetical protein
MTIFDMREEREREKGEVRELMSCMEFKRRKAGETWRDFGRLNP